MSTWMILRRPVAAASSSMLSSSAMTLNDSAHCPKLRLAIASRLRQERAHGFPAGPNTTLRHARRRIRRPDGLVTGAAGAGDRRHAARARRYRGGPGSGAAEPPPADNRSVPDGIRSCLAFPRVGFGSLREASGDAVLPCRLFHIRCRIGIRQRFQPIVGPAHPVRPVFVRVDDHADHHYPRPFFRRQDGAHAVAGSDGVHGRAHACTTVGFRGSCWSPTGVRSLS